MGGRNSTPSEDDKELQDKIQRKGGQPMEPGPMAMKTWDERGCTDILFLIFFILFIGGMFIVAGFGFAQGNPQRLHYGYDFNGHVCGSGINKDKGNLYYPYPFPPTNAITGESGSIDDVDLSWSVCVEKCPNPAANTVPNMCMLPFKSVTSSGGIVDCGNQDAGGTSMNQFSPTFELPTSGDVSGATVAYGADTNVGPFGYREYCMNRVPVCTPCNSEVCCDGTNQDGTKTLALTNATKYPDQSILGISLGRKYGFCFVPMPSTSVSFSTRCLPYSSEGVSSILNAYSSASSGNVTSSASKNALKGATGAVAKGLSDPSSVFSTLCDEVLTNRWIIVASAGIALVVALLYTQILRAAAGLLVWTVLILLWILLAGSTAILAFKAGVIKTSQIPVEVAGVVTGVPLPEGVTLGQAQTNQELVIIAAAIVGAVFVIYSLLICVMASRINLAIKVIKQAAACLAEIPTALLFPILQWIAMCALALWFVIVLLFLASAGEWNQETHTYNTNETTRRAIIFHFFGFLWIRAFILAVGNLVIAGATCDWFIIHDRSMLSAPVLSSLLRTLRFHTGTAAFGAFIIAVVQFIQWVFRYYMYQLQKFDKDNKIIKLFACIGECCLKCLERFLEFINKNAYIQTAMQGTCFCSSAKTAFSLLLRNCLRVGALATITTIFNNIGKLFIAVVTGLICALIIQGGDLANVADAPIFSVTIITILAFGIASAFIDVWDIVVGSIFQCFCMDLEKGSGKTGGEFKAFVAENEGKSASKREIASQI